MSQHSVNEVVRYKSKCPPGPYIGVTAGGKFYAYVGERLVESDSLRYLLDTIEDKANTTELDKLRAENEELRREFLRFVEHFKGFEKNSSDPSDAVAFERAREVLNNVKKVIAVKACQVT